VGNLSRDNIVDNITLYWLTGTAASAARWYWELRQTQATALAAGQAPPDVSLPVGFTTFPGEIFRAPRSWVEQSYPDLIYFNEADEGGPSPPGKYRSSFPRNCAPRSPPCDDGSALRRAATGHRSVGERARVVRISRASRSTASGVVPQKGSALRNLQNDAPTR
jgi:hypothetical protein